MNFSQCCEFAEHFDFKVDQCHGEYTVDHTKFVVLFTNQRHDRVVTETVNLMINNDYEGVLIYPALDEYQGDTRGRTNPICLSQVSEAARLGPEVSDRSVDRLL